jgi:hypothetical protein
MMMMMRRGFYVAILLCYVAGSNGCLTVENMHTCSMLNGIAFNTTLDVLSVTEQRIQDSGTLSSSPKCTSSNRTLSCWKEFAGVLCEPRKLCASMCFKRAHFCALGEKIGYGSAQAFSCMNTDMYSFLDDENCAGEKLDRVSTIDICFPEATNAASWSFNAATGYLAGILATFLDIDEFNVRPVRGVTVPKCVRMAFFTGDAADLDVQLADSEVKNFLFHYYRLFHFANSSLDTFKYTLGPFAEVAIVRSEVAKEEPHHPLEDETASWGFWWALIVMVPVLLFVFTCQKRKSVPNGEKIELNGMGDNDDDDDDENDDDLEMCLEPKKTKESVD